MLEREPANFSTHKHYMEAKIARGGHTLIGLVDLLVCCFLTLDIGKIQSLPPPFILDENSGHLVEFKPVVTRPWLIYLETSISTPQLQQWLFDFSR